jgi:hypothetical protein
VLPFKEKVYLFRIIEMWNRKRLATGVPLCAAPPRYKTFLQVLRRPEFSNVKFHRVVRMGRCPKCCLFRWKCLSAPAGERERWQAVAAAHQWLQLAQKRQYAADRGAAAADYPQQEAYFALDGGSGYEFVLPHQAAESPEFPSKALASFHTVPLKVMNGIVRGDTRSHVILSPGVLVSSASHTCESIMVVLNTVFDEHGDIPLRASVQLDNAANNHNMLVLAFMSLYVPRPALCLARSHMLRVGGGTCGTLAGACQVLHGVTSECRARFELENHAHDLYDAFHGIHASAVRKATFFHLEELISIIEGAHKAAGDAHDRSPTGARPLMGHRVLVSTLWSVRDLWGWLAPGRADDKDVATARAAFVSYDRLQQYRDFSLRLEATSTSENPRVGLWAKQYMSDQAYNYVGTVTTGELYRAVVGERLPEVAAESTTRQKTVRELAVLKKLRALQRGDYCDQFSAERLADAIAMCDRNWEHFRDSRAAMPADGRRLMLPHQLAEAPTTQ